MRRATMLVMSVGLAFALSMPVLGATVLARGGDPLNVTILPPVSNRDSWYGGAVMPIKILVTDPDDNSSIENANVTLWVNDLAATGPGKSMMNNTFVDLGGGYYQYNLETKPYPAGPGSPKIEITITVIAPDDRTRDVDILMSLR